MSQWGSGEIRNRQCSKLSTFFHFQVVGGCDKFFLKRLEVKEGDNHVPGIEEIIVFSLSVGSSVVEGKADKQLTEMLGYN